MKQLILILLCCSTFYLYSNNVAEAGGSNRGTFLSRGGYVIHPDDIFIESYIAQYDYEYPLPVEDEINLQVDVDVLEHNGYIQLGLKGQKLNFEDIPQMNISFCVDMSGSMSGMMPWVKSSFYIFIDKVRLGDIVSLVDMNTQARTLIPPTVIESEEDKTKFKRQVDKITASGGTDVFAGMKQSYLEVEKNFKPGSVNRVILMTDGMHNFGEMINKDILNLASDYKSKNINISTVLLGINTETGLMVDVAINGGGSSRFVSDHDEMKKIFSTELDRMIVPAARDIKLTLELNDNYTFKNTWGYQYKQEGHVIEYIVPTMHNGDYVTMLVETEVKDTQSNNVGTLSISYKDLNNTPKSIQGYEITHSIDDRKITNSRVRRTEGMLYFCRVLYDIANKTLNVNKLEQDMYQYADPSPQRDDLVEQVKLELNQNLQLIVRTQNYLNNITKELSLDWFEKELEILDNYTVTFNKMITAYQSTNSE